MKTVEQKDMVQAFDLGRTHVHYFKTTGDAYDAAMTGEDIDTGNDVLVGDILVVESEQVIGLADTWPIAVTSQRGQFHAPAMDIVKYCADNGIPAMRLAQARAMAIDAGW
jgi:hypothetical protein